MTDKLTRDRWMAEFCLLMASGLDVFDLTMFLTNESSWFKNHETTRLWWAYHDGRMAERCAAACALAQQKIDAVVSSTDWQSINAVARSDG